MLIALWLASVSSQDSSPPAGRLVLRPEMLVNETATGDARALVDEQTRVGDPAKGEGVAPTRPFFAGWTEWRYPVSVAVDLGGECRVDRVFLYNETSGGAVEVGWGKPFGWTSKSVRVEGYRRWTEVPVGVRTRWLRLTLKERIAVPELVVYGERLAPVVARGPVVRRRSPATMDALIGTNAFIDDPVGTIAPPSGFLREYHPLPWDLSGEDHKPRFQPSAAAGGNAWFFDDYYAKLKAAGVAVSPVVWQTPDWLSGSSQGEARPIAKGADPALPASYARYAAHLYGFAARYGSRKIPDAALDLAPGQPRRSGLGLLRYLEAWNEPDKTWFGREARFDPFELAAMMSAAYDGHRGALGPGHGVKTADPTMRLAMGGLANADPDYLDAMAMWVDAFRGGDFPADAINVHHYASTAGDQGWKADTKALSPEADGLEEKMARVGAWRDLHAPGRELWVTEFGYDDHVGSPLYAAPLGTMSAERVKAAWLLRSYLALAAAGVDKATMFMLRDVDSKSSTVFSTSGIVGPKGDWKPKAAYFAVSALRADLRGMRFGAKVATGRTDVRVTRFDAEGGKGHAYAVWCPTSEDRRVTRFRLALPPGKARRIDLLGGTTRGASTTLPRNGTGATIDVSETPILVLTEGREG